ncbi:MAG TPA: hybrid sensor histidine kinase/response regulator [Candidatus Eisenbacteria bacterium]|nr:hybrid sensor histidine kinase/response regulator [Candidatus Eisenbacteria bacterium]
MEQATELSPFESEVVSRFGILPNFFQSAKAAPELIQELWGFAKAGYLDNPMPSLFKERLFVWLSRFCPMRYCIVRHVGFLLGHGHSSGDRSVRLQTTDEVVRLLKMPTPWHRDMDGVYAALEGLPAALAAWPESGTAMEDRVFACAALMFVEPARSERASRAILHAFGARQFEFFSGCLAFIRTAHYWTMLHPEIESEEDMLLLMRGHAELGRLLLEDDEAERCEMGQRMFSELAELRGLHERRDLEKAKRALEEKDRQKDQFIAVLAHELRNPLAAIRTVADAMRLLGLDDAQFTRLQERLDRQATAMARMLDDLLDASRVAFGKVSVTMEPVDLRNLVQEAFDEQDMRIREAGLRLQTRIAERPCFVLGDRVRLRQIVDNLLANAIKYTPSGGSIAIELAIDRGLAVVTIEDTGVGFDADFADKLFEPFTQHEQGRDRMQGGLGLGLAIASRLAQLQGGSISATSDGLGRGARFEFRMPLSQQVVTVSGDFSTPLVVTSMRPKLLLVEDNEDVADGLAEMLRMDGFVVSVAHDGPSALKEALRLVPDVILCDLGLPEGMDGYAVARACRAEPMLQSVRLLAASGYSAADDHKNAKAAGFDCLLTKPVTLESLKATLNG